MSGLLTECLLSCQLDSIRFVTLLIWYIARRSNSTDHLKSSPEQLLRNDQPRTN